MSGPLSVGDVVAISGDKRWNHSLKCCSYLPEQLVDGKYLKHTGTGEVWTAKIVRFTSSGEHAVLDSGGAWRADLLEKYE